MGAFSDVVRRIQIVATAVGLDQVAAALGKVAGAEDAVAVASDRAGKATLSVDRALLTLKKSLDSAYAAELKMEQVQRTLTLARNQGAISLAEENRLLGLAKLKYTEAGESAKLMGESMKVGAEAAHGLLMALGPIAGITAIFELPSKIVESVKSASELSATAQTIGVTAENLQKLDYAAKQTDISTGTMNSALERFSKNLGQAVTGSGALAKVLRDNHIIISGDVTKDFENYMSLLARTSNQEQKNFYSTTAFGKSAEELGRMANIGADGIKRYGDEAEATGQILDEHTRQSTEALNHEFIKMQGTLGTAFQEFMINIAPALEGAMWAITTAVRAANAAIADWQYAQQLSLPQAQQSTTFLRNQVDVLKKQLPTLASAPSQMTLADSPMAADPGNLRGKAIAAQLAPSQQGVQVQIDQINAVLAQRYRDHPETGGAFTGGWGSAAFTGPAAKAAADAAAAAAAAKAAQAAAAAQAKAIATVTDALKQQTAALTETDRQKFIDQELSQAKVASASAEGKLIEAEAGNYYDLQKAIQASNEAASFLAQTTYDAFSNVLNGSEDVVHAFLDIAQAIAKAALQAELLGTGPLSDILGTSPSKSGDASGILGTVIKAVLGGITGSAFGTIGVGGVGIPSGGFIPGLTGPKLFASGGLISGPGTGTSDSIPARLSAGEYVVNAASTSMYRGLLDTVNYGRRYASGGYVGAAANSNGGVTVNLVVNGSNLTPAQLMTAVKQQIVPVLNRHAQHGHRSNG